MNDKKNCGMHAIIDGFLKYRSKGLFKQFEPITDHPDVKLNFIKISPANS
jgi:hypothetical protein